MTQPSAAWTRLKYQIGHHPITSLVIAACLAVWGAAFANAEFNNGPKCRAIWAMPQLHVWASLAPPFRCLRQPRPIESLIPSDSVLETAGAELEGGPK